MKNIFLLLSITVMMLGSCKKDSAASTTTADCSAVSATFATDVLPLFQSSCSYNSSCHGTGSGEGPGALTTYQQIYNYRSSIRSSVSSGTMPRSSSLTTAKKTRYFAGSTMDHKIIRL